MAAKIFHIAEAELKSACRYIEGQFAAHGWWPREQPGEARREFELMKGSPAALTIWCERWLDAGQAKKLERSLRG